MTHTPLEYQGSVAWPGHTACANYGTPAFAAQMAGLCTDSLESLRRWCWPSPSPRMRGIETIDCEP
jgi:hypothetical protein